MRHIYLIRHGQPDFPYGVSRCIGRTDYPLSAEGLHQAQKLGSYFSQVSLKAVYSSTMMRAVQTADEIVQSGASVCKLADLQELDCGVWEGLTFDEIKKKYPELYDKRGTDPLRFFPDRGECLTDALLRFRSAVDKILNESVGDIAIVAHASVNRLLLCSLRKMSLNEIYSIHQPYGCINEIIEENGTLRVKRTGYLPDEYPDEDMIRCLWEKYHTPENVIRHCRAVTQKAMEMTEELASGGYELNKSLIYSSAMLHDIARSQPDHPAQGAKWIAKEGYDKVAAVISAHHDLNEKEQDPVTEKTIVFLADKLICKDKDVTLDERFAISIVKCTTPEAITSHKRKQDQAVSALRRVQLLLGRER